MVLEASRNHCFGSGRSQCSSLSTVRNCGTYHSRLHSKAVQWDILCQASSLGLDMYRQSDSFYERSGANERSGPDSAMTSPEQFFL